MRVRRDAELPSTCRGPDTRQHFLRIVSLPRSARTPAGPKAGCGFGQRNHYRREDCENICTRGQFRYWPATLSHETTVNWVRLNHRAASFPSRRRGSRQIQQFSADSLRGKSPWVPNAAQFEFSARDRVICGATIRETHGLAGCARKARIVRLAGAPIVNNDRKCECDEGWRIDTH